MTVKEFWEIVDKIDIDSREDSRYTDDELYTIGCAFIGLNNSQKREIGGWDALVGVLKPLDKNGDPMKRGETFRQWVKTRRYAKEEVPHNERLISGKTIESLSFKEFADKTEEIKKDLYKQQVKTRDVLNSYRRTLREEARVDTIKELIKESVAELPPLSEVKYEDGFLTEIPNEAIMLISDLHIGMEIDSFYNKYNVEIARQRMNKYVNDTINICKENGIQRLTIANLNDLIHGIIHVTARLESEIDAVSQVMVASEIMADALNRLQEAAPEVIYRSVTDNHSRAVAAYKEHVEIESLSRLIDFYLEARLADTSIIFAKDNLECDISLFELLNGKKVVCSHGHRDNLNTIIQNYVGATKQFIDYVCVGHYHESKVKSFQGSKVFVNGSICGVDGYAQSKRLYGDPEQTLLLFKDGNLSVNYIDLSIA